MTIACASKIPGIETLSGRPILIPELDKPSSSISLRVPETDAETTKLPVWLTSTTEDEKVSNAPIELCKLVISSDWSFKSLATDSDVAINILAVAFKSTNSLSNSVILARAALILPKLPLISVANDWLKVVNPLVSDKVICDDPLIVPSGRFTVTVVRSETFDTSTDNPELALPVNNKTSCVPSKLAVSKMPLPEI